MTFQWKDRKGAVSQASYQFRLSKERVEKFIQEMTPEELDDLRGIYGPEWAPQFAVDGTVQECVELVLGTGTRFKNYFCTNPESMSARQYVQFKNDVKNDIRYRADVDELIKGWGVQVGSS